MRFDIKQGSGERHSKTAVESVVDERAVTTDWKPRTGLGPVSLPLRSPPADATLVALGILPPSVAPPLVCAVEFPHFVSRLRTE